jgi:hypothetical protein
MHLNSYGIALLSLLISALPAFGDEGGRELFFPGSVAGGGAGNFSNVNVAGVLNVNTFAGADLGAKMNNAISTLPKTGAGATPRGTIYIPNGDYTLSTTALLPPDASVNCDKGARIHQTAAIGFNQNVHDATGVDFTNGQPAALEFSASGGVDNCWFDGSGGPNGEIGLQTGDTCGLHYVDDKFYNYYHPNDWAMSVVNKIYFTEHYWIKDLILEQDTGGLKFTQRCLPYNTGPPATGPGSGCANSMMYGFIDIPHCGTAYGYNGTTTGANAVCLGVYGGVNVGRVNINMHGNLAGTTGISQRELYTSNEQATSPEHTWSQISVSQINLQFEDNGTNPSVDYWAYDASGQGQIGTNFGSHVDYPVTQSQPPGLNLQGNPFTGQAVNLNPDPGFRYGSTFWDLPTGWSVLPNRLNYGTPHTDPHNFPIGAGLNAAGVLGTGAASTARQAASVDVPVPKSPNIPTCHYNAGTSDRLPNNFTDCIWMCYTATFDGSAITAGNFQVSIWSGGNAHNYSFAYLGPGTKGGILNNCSPLDQTGAAHWYINPARATIANGQYVLFAAPMWSEGRVVQPFTDSFGGTGAGQVPPLARVTNIADLPNTPNNARGQAFIVNDWNGTIGACVGGGSVWGQAIWTGSSWQCH